MSDVDWPPAGLSERDLVQHVDTQAEEAVLGAVLLVGDLIGQLLDVGLAPEHFWRMQYGELYEAMIALHRSGAGVDRVTLQDELRRTGGLERIGGPAVIEALSGGTPVVGNALDYARVVRRLAFLRRRREAGLLVAADPADQDRWAGLVQIAETPDDGEDDRREFDLRELLALADVEPPWRCDGLAADGHVTTLVGRGGEGKSLLSLGLAGAVQSGSALAGIDCKPGSVVLFDAENGAWVLGSRLAQITGMPFDKLRIFNAEGRDLGRNRGWFTARAEGAQLVILDSIRTLAPGAKENDSDDMAPVMGAIRHIARTTGAAVIAIHHRGKGELDFRGSSAIRDQTDMLFVLGRDEKDPEKTRRQLRCVKCRIAEEPDPRWLTIRAGKGEIYFTEAAPYEPEEAPERPVRDELEETIAGVIADRGPITRKQIARELGRTENDGTVRRALKELLTDEVVVQISGHRYITAPVNSVDTGATLPLAPDGTPGTPSLPEGVPARARVKGAGTLAPPDGEAL